MALLGRGLDFSRVRATHAVARVTLVLLGLGFASHLANLLIRATGLLVLSDPVSAVQMLVRLATTVAFLTWFYLTYSNLARLRVPGLRHRPVLAVLGFLIPVANLIVPWRMMHDLWTAFESSDPDRDGVARRAARASPLVDWWWACFLSGALADLVSTVMLARHGLPAGIRLAGILGYLLGQGLSAVAAILSIDLVRRIDRRQISTVGGLGGRGSPWHRMVAWAGARLYFHRITVLHPERLPHAGPILYVGLHRNGAVDGIVYSLVLPRAIFVISAQLTRSLLGKLFFSGIEVVRDRDEGNRAQNAEAMKQCRALLRSCGELFIFPEGTSTLGPRHLPFKSGAARLIVQALDDGVRLAVVPLGISYERAWAFRSNVEVVVGPPVSTEGVNGLTEAARLAEMNRRLETALETVGVNVQSAEYFELIQKLAYIATLGTSISYHAALKRLESTVPPDLVDGCESLEVATQQRSLRTHHGVPLFPTRSPLFYLLLLVPLAFLVAAGALVNTLPLGGAYWAGRRLADDRNVTAMWRLLVGLPLLILWALLLAGLSISIGQPALFVTYVLLTALSLRAYRPVKKLAVAVHNALREPSLRLQALAFRDLVIQHLRGASG